MHLQTSVPGWLEALLVLPDRCLLKTFEPSLLREAKLRWQMDSRDPAKLYTDYRHFDFDYRVSTDLGDMQDKWRDNFRRFVDVTYVEQYAVYVDLIETLNEYTDTRMVTDKALLAPHLTNAQAAIDIWHREFRGKLVPENCRLIICNSPVGNDIPYEFYKLAVTEDAVLGVHPYTHWPNLARDPGDWRYHSGRWHFNEQEYGLKPLYAFTECGPYASSSDGWRAPQVCGGRLELLLEAFRLWLGDVRTTDAYREGRIFGPGAWFTSGGWGWELYQLDAAQLRELAWLMKSEWTIGPMPTTDLVPDASYYQASQNDDGSYRVIIDLQRVKDSGVAGMIWRAGDGLFVDPVFEDYRLLSKAVEHPWGAYHFYRSRRGAWEQADLVYSLCSEIPPLGVWADLEESTPSVTGAALFDRIDAYLRRLDERFGVLAGIYSRASWLDYYIPAELQKRWSHRKLWIAHYFTFAPAIPYGWEGLAQPYVLWQYGQGSLPGVPKIIDLNRTFPGRTVSDLYVTGVPGVSSMDIFMSLRNLPTVLQDQVEAHMVALQADVQTTGSVKPYDPPAIQSHWYDFFTPPYVVKVNTLPLTTYKAPDGAVYDVRSNATYDLNVSERQGGWLKVAPLPLWVKADDVHLVRIG